MGDVGIPVTFFVESGERLMWGQPPSAVHSSEARKGFVRSGRCTKVCHSEQLHREEPAVRGHMATAAPAVHSSEARHFDFNEPNW